MYEILTLSLKILILLFFVGIGAANILTPKRLKDYSFWLSPWFGVMTIAIFGAVLNLSNIPMNQGKYLIIGISSASLLYAIFKKKITLRFNSDFFYTALLTAVIFYIYLHPLIKDVGFPSSISFANLDVVSYVNVGDYLMKYTVWSKEASDLFKPYVWSIGDFVQTSFRWGSPYQLSFFASVLQIRSYEIFHILLAFFFSLSFPLVYILTRILYPKADKLTSTVLFFIFGFNSTLQYMIYHVFFAQFIYAGIFIVSVILFYSYIQEYKCRENIFFNIYDLLIAFCLSSITTIYSEGFIFAFSPLIIFGVLSLIPSKKISSIFSIVKIFFLTIVINPVTFIIMFKRLLGVAIVAKAPGVIGWEAIRNASSLEMMGLYNLYYSPSLSFNVSLLLSLVVFGIWAFGFNKIKEKGLIASYLVVIISFLALVRYLFPNFFVYHKAITYCLFIFTVLFSIGISAISQRFKGMLLISIIVTLIAYFSIQSYQKTFILFNSNNKIVDKSLSSLKELDSNPEINEAFYTQDIYFGDEDLWKRFWTEHFLMNKNIVTYQNYFYIDEKERDNIRLVLVDKKTLESKKEKMKFKSIVWKNDFFQLGEIESLDVYKDLRPKKLD